MNTPRLSLIFLILTHFNSCLSESNCSLLLDIFANSSSKFTSCAIYNSRPITLCENCVEPYLKVIDSYNNMSKVSDNDTLCIDNFVHVDRLEIVETLYQNSFALWNRAKCYKCYQVVNGSLTPNKSEETLTFNKLVDDFTSCLNGSNVNDSTICSICLEDYVNLDSYYTSISNENERIGVCMDIVDLMNSTRSFWSQKCCKFRRHNEYLFIASMVVVLVLTVLFYALTQTCSIKQTPTILQQTRFAESFSNPIGFSL